MQRNVHTWGRYFLLLSLLTLLAVGPLSRTWAAEATVLASTPQSLMADQLLRIANNILLEKAQPGTSQLIRAGMMVDLAIQSDPSDADAWLLRKTLAQMAGDTDAAADALRRYCQLKPSDDAAGLQLILAGLRGKTTSEAKADALEQFLNAASKDAMSSALRSRVAGYLASLYQQIGDSTRFGFWLKEAATLDPSNRDAARLMYELAVSRGGSDYAIGQMLLHMIKAAPVDDMPRHLMADLLASMGAYEAAQKQYVIASTLGVRQGGDKFLTNWMISMAASGRADKALDMIDTMGFSAGQADPKAVPMDTLILKLAILSQNGRNDEAVAVFNSIRSRLQQRVDMGDVQAALELAWWTAAFGPTISTSFEQAVMAYASANPDNGLIQRTLGWVHYRKGRYDDAANALHVLAETDPWAVYGLAKCTQGQNTELQVGYLQKTIRMSASSPAGMMAASDLKSTGQRVVVSADAKKLIDAISDLPTNILMPLSTRSSSWTSLGIDVKPKQFGYLDPIVAEVTLRNTSEYPLTLGPAGTLPTTMAIYLAPWRGGEPIKGVSPVMVDIGRSLRLDSRQTITVPVRLDRGQLGLMMAQNPAAAIGFSVTAILDPRNTAKGGLTTGPMGGVALLKFIDRTAMRPTPGNIDAWISQFKSPTDALSHMKLIATLCSLTESLNQLPQMQAQATRIATAVNDQFANLGALGQAWMTLFTPAGSAGKSLFPNVCNGAAQSDNVTVRLVYLATHSDDLAAVTAAAGHSDPRISAFAKALQTP